MTKIPSSPSASPGGGLTIYLQLDFVLHDVPLPDVVVGGGADEEVAVVAGLGVVQQH